MARGRPTRLPIALSPDGAILPFGLGAPEVYSRTVVELRALLDTGANRTAVRPTALHRVGAPTFGVMPVSRPGGGGVDWMPTALVRLRPGGPDPGGDGPRWFELEVIATDPADPEVDILLGVDFLLGVTLRWDGPGRVASMEIPPQR